eukprot:Nk52_evm80s158 gene=Nk52_evmTU80s158
MSTVVQKGGSVMVMVLALCIALLLGASSSIQGVDANSQTITVRVMTFNFYVYRGQLSTQVELINNSNHWLPAKADIIGVQEALTVRMDEIKSQSGLQYVGKARDWAQGEHSSIFYNANRFQVLHWETISIAHPSAAYPRIFTFAKMKEISSGVEFYFYNTHLDNASADARRHGATIIADHIRNHPRREGLPYVLTGDMNAGWGAGEFEYLKRDNLVSQMYVDGIDWIVGSGNSMYSQNNRRFHDIKASDHPVLSTELVITAGGSGPGPQPEPSTCSIEQDVDYSGNDIGHEQSTDHTGCCGKCASKSGCNAWSWSSYNGGTCWFKSSGSGRVNRAGVVSGLPSREISEDEPVNEDPQPEEQPESPASGGSYKTKLHVDIVGPNLAVIKGVPTAEECPAHCDANPACTSFVWGPWSDGSCYLKAAATVLQPHSSVKSGTKCGILRDRDFPGNDLSSVSGASVGDCCGLCRGMSQCRGYTWTPWKGGTCFLKSATPPGTDVAYEGAIAGGFEVGAFPSTSLE